MKDIRRLTRKSPPNRIGTKGKPQRRLQKHVVGTQPRGICKGIVRKAL